ncbi:MAG TPA: hypothetical protein VHA74_02675 [Candidatus Dojkabacteria bacterium]|nr:hypothetical protein [Candidatus Dojkabacteria bacterium]
MYPQDEELLEVHCNTCRASWNPDGTLRSIPSEEKLERLGVLSLAYDNGLPVATDPSGEWNSINQEEFYNEVKVSI